MSRKSNPNTAPLQAAYLSQSPCGIVPGRSNDFPHVDKSQHGDLQRGEQPFGYSQAPTLSNNPLTGVAGILLAAVHKEQLAGSAGETGGVQ